MPRNNGNAVAPGQEAIPVQAVERPIICGPYDEPADHWIYDKESGAASRAGTRRPASYWYKTERTGGAQLTLTGLAEEERDDLPLVNALREDVYKWRKAGYPGATNAVEYPRLSWYIHSGLTGFANLQEESFELMAGIAFTIAVKSYMALMTAIIDEFKLDKHDPKIKTRMQYAQMVPWTDGEVQAAQPGKELGLE